MQHKIRGKRQVASGLKHHYPHLQAYTLRKALKEGTSSWRPHALVIKASSASTCILRLRLCIQRRHAWVWLRREREERVCLRRERKRRECVWRERGRRECDWGERERGVCLRRARESLRREISLSVFHPYFQAYTQGFKWAAGQATVRYRPLQRPSVYADVCYIYRGADVCWGFKWEAGQATERDVDRSQKKNSDKKNTQHQQGKDIDL